MSVGCDKKTSRAAAQTLAISAFLSGGDFVTLPEYPASSSLAIILSTSRTCRPAPGLPAVMLPRLIVAERAAPGERLLLEALGCNRLPSPLGPGDDERPLGDEAMAEGGGDVPRRDERRPPEGDAAIVVFVGPRGDGGANLALPPPAPGMGEPAARVTALSASSDPSPPEPARIVGFDPAELKLDTDPLAPLDPFLPRDGVPNDPLPLTSIGDGGDDEP